MYELLHRTGSGIREYLERIGGSSILAVQSLFEFILPPYRLAPIAREIFEIGVRSFWVIELMGLCVGIVMVAQAGILLSRFSAEIYVAQLVTLAVFRELGPGLAGFIVASRAGSGMAAELGSMQVSEQIDAMRACGASPVRLLVMPKVIASIIAMPLLAAGANIAGVIGGMIASTPLLGLDFNYYLMSIPRAVFVGDFTGGLGKALIYGLIVAVVSCNEGLRAQHGSTGVRVATDRAVVMSLIMILMADVIINGIIIAVNGI